MTDTPQTGQPDQPGTPRRAGTGNGKGPLVARPQDGSRARARTAARYRTGPYKPSGTGPSGTGPTGPSGTGVAVPGPETGPTGPTPPTRTVPDLRTGTADRPAPRTPTTADRTTDQSADQSADRAMGRSVAGVGRLSQGQAQALAGLIHAALDAVYAAGAADARNLLVAVHGIDRAGPTVVEASAGAVTAVAALFDALDDLSEPTP